MKLCVGVAPLLVCLASASSLNFLRREAPAVDVKDDKVKVPGESPLEFCPGNHDGDIKIEHVDLVPNPPLAGKDLVIKARGTLKETIEDGAYAKVTVKYGLIKLLDVTADLCEQIGNVDLKCPVKPGELNITKSVNLPPEIPPVRHALMHANDAKPSRTDRQQGTYTVLADFFTAEDKQITCLTATIKFNAKKLGFSNEL